MEFRSSIDGGLSLDNHQIISRVNFARSVGCRVRRRISDWQSYSNLTDRFRRSARRPCRECCPSQPEVAEGKRAGYLAIMLHCFFDDSGTHAQSELAVWGGVVGATGHVAKLDAAWQSLLSEPLPGKAPIRKFGVGDCRWAEGDFQLYSPPERDWTRNRFRSTILDSGMKPFAFGVDRRAWDRIVTGDMREAYATGASGVAFSGCADIAVRLAAYMPGSHMLCVFDQGQRSAENESLLVDASARAKAHGVGVTFTFAAVKDVVGLQAADTIATEHYWYGCDRQKDPEAPLPPHLRHLVTSVKTRAFFLDKPQIMKLRASYRRSLDDDPATTLRS
jgi:hypothetical protein